VQVKTNHHWRQFVYRTDVPDSILNGDLDWTNEEDSDWYLQYRGVWYHLSQFMHGGPWGDGFHADTFFSGVAIRLSKDCEEYQIATVYGE
jgi:hypothetical protein